LLFTVETIKYASIYPQIKQILNSISEVQSHLFYVEKVVHLENQVNGERRTESIKAFGGLYIQVDTPEIGHIVNGWKVIQIQRKDLPTLYYILFATIFVLITAFPRTLNRFILPVFSFFTQRIPSRLSKARGNKIIFVIFKVVRIYFIFVFVYWSLASIVKLLSKLFAMISKSISFADYLFVLALIVSFATLVTIILQREKSAT